MANLDGWSYCKKITVPANSIDADLEYFPLSVYLNSTNFDFTKCKGDGSDIRFTDKDLNFLKFERKQHSALTMAVYNVQVPTVSDLSDTEVYMWYGNASAYNTSIEAWQDMTGKALTYNGNVKIVRNSASDHYASFDGNGDYVSMPYSTDIDLLQNSFTIEGKIYPTNFSIDRRVMATGGTALAWNLTNGLQVLIQTIGTSGALNVQLKDTTTSGNINFTSSAVLTLSTKNDFAVGVDNTNKIIYLSVNGVTISSSYASSAMGRPTTNPTFTMATSPAELGTPDQSFGGHIYGMRITKGRARYTANYTPPTTFTIDGADVVFCTNFDTIYDNNYAMVQHMGDSLVDASGNGNNGTATGTTVVDTDYGNVRDLTLTSEALTFPATSAIFDTADSTIISMVFPKNFTNRPLWYKVVTAGTDTAYHFGVRTTTGKPTLAFYSDDLDGATTLPLGDWSVVVGRHIRSTKEQKVYLDGVLDGTRTATNNVSNTNNATLTYGYRAPNNTTGSISRIGETRISNIARSDAWIKAESLALKNALITLEDYSGGAVAKPRRFVQII